MTISTYATLQTAVADWLHRTDATTVIQTCISLAESEIASDVRCLAMESIATGTIAAGLITFPTRFLEAKALTVGGNVYRYVAQEQYAEKVTAASLDRVFTIIGQTFYVLNGGTQTYALTYYAAFAGLSASSDTNWLLTNAPDVYLFGALRHAAVYTVDDAAASKYSGMYGAAVQRINAREAAGSVSGGPLQMFSTSLE